MLYRTLMMAAAMALPAVAGAGDASSGSDAETDIKVTCIIEFVESDLDADRHDVYIEECVQKQLAARKTPAASKG